MATHGFPGTFGVVVGVAGVLSNILTITMMACMYLMCCDVSLMIITVSCINLLSLDGVIYPVPAPVAAFNVSLLEDVPIPAYVTVCNPLYASPFPS